MPANHPLLEITWNDPESDHTGYLVVDRLVDGACGGGLRMRPGCTVEEVADLARAMTLKEGIVFQPGHRYRPQGGAKGGIDCDPADPDAPGVMKRYLEAMRPMLLSAWASGEDLGVQQRPLDDLAAELGLHSSAHAALERSGDVDAALDRIRTSFDRDADGLALGDVIGGYGVAQATLAAMDELGLQPEQTRAVVQGFGCIGGAAARYLARAGVAVVGVADVEGLLVDPDGLDVERLLGARDALGTIDRSALPAEVRSEPRERWLSLEAEVLVPSATSYVIDEANCDQVRAELIVEGANVPVVRAAEDRLRERGVAVLPDFVANVGANAWWYWTLFGDVEPERDATFAKVGETLQSITRETFARAARDGTSLRTAGERLARERLEAYDRLRA